MNTKIKIASIVTTILLFIGFAGPAQAVPTEPEVPAVVQTVDIPVAAPTVSLNFDRVAVETTPAPEYIPVVPATTSTIAPQSGPTAPVVVQKTPVAPTTLTSPVSPSTAPTASVAPPVAVASVGGAGLLASARSQIGQTQDCTRMVERALGTPLDLAPAQFFQFGTVVPTPAPGDIIISAGHVGIYSGNGMMISGGFNGNQTVEHPISYVGGYSAVRVA